MTLYEEILLASLNGQHVSFAGLYSACKFVTAAFWRYACSFTASVLRSQVGWGHAVAQLVEALRYKPEGRGFDSRWCH